MKYKIIKSNNSHLRFAKKHLENGLNSNPKTPNRFMGFVLATYHTSIIDKQEKENKLLSKEEKVSIYKKSYKDTIDTFKGINKDEPNKGQYWYIPGNNAYFKRNKKNGLWSEYTHYKK